jgi:AraC-like DNA-binding protein
MDKPGRKMDIPTARPVTVPCRPLSFGVRLAHIHGIPVASRPVRGQLRVLSDFELILQLDGASWIWSEEDGGSVDLAAGSVGFIPPGFVHAWGGESGSHIAVHFDFHAQPELQVPDNMRFLDRTVTHQPLPFIPRVALRFDGGDDSLILPLVTALPRPEPWREQLETLVDLWSRRAVSTLEGNLSAARVLTFAIDSLAAPERVTDRTDSRIRALVRTLEGSLADRMSVAELAAQAHMGETSFRAAFARATGSSPRRYLEERRIEHAARVLIETDYTVAEISRAVGYTDPYHFSRVFRRIKGLSPRQYRKQTRSP